MKPIRIKSGPATRKTKWNQFIQFRWAPTKVMPKEKTHAGYISTMSQRFKRASMLRTNTHNLVWYHNYWWNCLWKSCEDKIRFSSNIKGALSGLRQFLATKSPLKMIKNVFYFTSKALFVFKGYLRCQTITSLNGPSKALID